MLYTPNPGGSLCLTLIWQRWQQIWWWVSIILWLSMKFPAVVWDWLNTPIYIRQMVFHEDYREALKNKDNLDSLIVYFKRTRMNRKERARKLKTLRFQKWVLGG